MQVRVRLRLPARVTRLQRILVRQKRAELQESVDTKRCQGSSNEEKDAAKRAARDGHRWRHDGG